MRAVLEEIAATLHGSADLICDGRGHPVDDPAVVRRLRDELERLGESIRAQRDSDLSMLLVADDEPGGSEEPTPADDRDPADTAATEAVSANSPASRLDPGLHVRTLGIITEMVADATLAAAGAERSGPPEVLGTDCTLRPCTFWRRFSSHLSFRSVWFRNSLRVAGLALVVAVVEVSDVSHGFWVVLGALSVLRTSVLGTGATALRAVGGTVVGFVVGSAIMIGVSDHWVLLWVLLPPAVLLVGDGPHGDLVRGLVGRVHVGRHHPVQHHRTNRLGGRADPDRGRGDRLRGQRRGGPLVLAAGRHGGARDAGLLSAAFVANSGYLADAVDRLTMTAWPVDTRPSQRVSHSAYLRLDDAFREYFAERGAKAVPVETVARLFTGANRIGRRPTP